MQVKRSCRHTTHRQTDGDTWSTRQLKTKMMFLLLLYWNHFNSSWPVAEGCTLTHLCPLHLKTNTKFLQFYLPQPGAARVQTAKLSWLHLFSSPDLSLLSPTFPTASSLLASMSPSLLNSLQKPAKLHCHVTLTSQLKWHNGYNLTTLKFQHYDNSLNYSSNTTTNYFYYNPWNIQKHPMSFN